MGVGQVLCWMNFGGLPQDKIRRKEEGRITRGGRKKKYLERGEEKKEEGREVEDSKFIWAGEPLAREYGPAHLEHPRGGRAQREHLEGQGQVQPAPRAMVSASAAAALCSATRRSR